jgi:hypothetical protein
VHPVLPQVGNRSLGFQHVVSDMFEMAPHHFVKARLPLEPVKPGLCHPHRASSLRSKRQQWRWTHEAHRLPMVAGADVVDHGAGGDSGAWTSPRRKREMSKAILQPDENQVTI